MAVAVAPVPLASLTLTHSRVVVPFVATTPSECVGAVVPDVPDAVTM